MCVTLPPADVDVGELQSLERALSGRILEVSLARGQVAVADAAARFNAALSKVVTGKPGRGERCGCLK